MHHYLLKVSAVALAAGMILGGQTAIAYGDPRDAVPQRAGNDGPQPAPAPAPAPLPPAANAADAVFAPVPTPVPGTESSGAPLAPLAVLAVQSNPQAVAQGRTLAGAPQTIIFANGEVLYDYGSKRRAAHDGYTPPTVVMDSAQGPITYEKRDWKIAQLGPVQLQTLIDSLAEQKLDHLGQNSYNYAQLPHYVLTYWEKDPAAAGALKARTIIAGGPLNPDDCDDSFYKTDDIHSLNGAPDYEVDATRRHTPPALLSAIDRLQYYNPAQSTQPDPNTFYLHLAPARKAKAQTWPEELPQIDAGDLQASDADANDFTSDLQQSEYQAIKDKLSKQPRNDVYLVAGHPFHVGVRSDYILPALPSVMSALLDTTDDASGS